MQQQSILEITNFLVKMNYILLTFLVTVRCSAYKSLDRSSLHRQDYLHSRQDSPSSSLELSDYFVPVGEKRKGLKKKKKKKQGIFPISETPPARGGKVGNLFMIFFQHPSVKFTSFLAQFTTYGTGEKGVQWYSNSIFFWVFQGYFDL